MYERGDDSALTSPRETSVEGTNGRDDVDWVGVVLRGLRNNLATGSFRKNFLRSVLKELFPLRVRWASMRQCCLCTPCQMIDHMPQAVVTPLSSFLLTCKILIPPNACDPFCLNSTDIDIYPISPGLPFHSSTSGRAPQLRNVHRNTYAKMVQGHQLPVPPNHHRPSWPSSSPLPNRRRAYLHCHVPI